VLRGGNGGLVVSSLQLGYGIITVFCRVWSP
jgi:hypothetical protein